MSDGSVSYNNNTTIDDDQNKQWCSESLLSNLLAEHETEFCRKSIKFNTDRTLLRIIPVLAPVLNATLPEGDDRCSSMKVHHSEDDDNNGFDKVIESNRCHSLLLSQAVTNKFKYDI